MTYVVPGEGPVDITVGLKVGQNSAGTADVLYDSLSLGYWEVVPPSEEAGVSDWMMY